MADIRRIEEDLLRFLASRGVAKNALTPNTDLLESGLLDSLMVMDLTVHVESKYGIGLDSSDISPQHFRSLSALARLVAGKLSDRRDASAGPAEQ